MTPRLRWMAGFLFLLFAAVPFVTPVGHGSARQEHAAPMQTKAPAVPILMYHYIDDHDDRKDPRGTALYVSPASFAKQLQWLADHHYHTITLDDLTAIVQSGKKPPEKPIVLTFDDGYADAHSNALPALLKQGMKGVFYIVTGFMGKANYLTKGEVEDLSAKGMEIAAHTVNHLDLRSLSQKARKFELQHSKEVLELLLHHPIVHLAYPSGRYTNAVSADARALGYVTAVTTHTGIVRAGMNMMMLPRVRVTNTTLMDSVLP